MIPIAIALVLLLAAWLSLRAAFSRAIAEQASARGRPRVHGRAIAARIGLLVIALIGVFGAVWVELGRAPALVLAGIVIIGVAAGMREGLIMAKKRHAASSDAEPPSS